MIPADDSPRAAGRGAVGWRVAVRRAGHGFVRHRGIDAAAALTFFSLLALLPGALAVVSVFAIFDDRDRAVQDLVAVLDTVLPDQAARDLEGVLRELLSLNNPHLALAFALVLLLWTTSGYETRVGLRLPRLTGVVVRVGSDHSRDRREGTVNPVAQ